MARRTPNPPARAADSVPIVLYTRAACHLCEEMKAELERAGLFPPDALREVDVDGDPALAARYGTIVPVLEIGGRVAWRARIRPGTLQRRYARLVERYHRAGPGSAARTYARGSAEPHRPGTAEREVQAAETTRPTLRVLLVDDHELVRSALADAITRQAGFEVVGVAADGDEALARLDECAPDAVVMDIDVPGDACFDAVRRMRDERPELRVVFLSAFCLDRSIEQALAVGANGYVLKAAPLESLFEALREVARGRDSFAPEVRARLHAGAPATRAAALTERELEVLRHLARGLSKKEIARTLQLSVKTVEHHAAALMRKLDIHDRVELARYAIREGLAEA